MSNIRAYWAAVREAAASLKEPWPYVMSLEDPSRGIRGGVVVQVSRDAAAELIARKTHRLATEQEVSGHLADEDRKRVEYAEMEIVRRRYQNPPIDPVIRKSK
ncbi:MAG: hypothetical protein IT168_33235 [Bryobacterales bacterium]|nr:hypothetical protein [Bryobacterales bacterium]